MQYTLFSDNEQAPSSDNTADFKDLNAAQHKAVTHGEGPVLVIAGAGSGKTRTLIHRVAHLIDNDVPPESILLLTFTRRAAKEMLDRAGRLTDRSCGRITGGTFHGTSNILLHRYGHYLGYRPGFTIVDRADAEGIINLLKSSLDLAGAGKTFPNKRTIINILSGSINKNISIDNLISQQAPHLTEFLDDILLLKKHYEQFKFDHALMDYDDLLVNWYRLLKESPEARHEISSQYQYIMVDEYQDTNHIQAKIIRLLAHTHENVMAVGDDAQSIYNFRGADFYNIIRFPDQFPGTEVIKLEQNYRSIQPILDLTNSIISCAKEKFTKTLFTNIEGTEKPVVYAARNESGEAKFIADTISELIEDGTDPGRIAVLFRSGYHSYKLEMELTSRMLEFEKRGGLKLTETAHIKDVLSFFRILINPWDTLSWSRLLLHLDKVGPKTVQKIIAFISEHDDPGEALEHFKAGKSWQDGFQALIAVVKDIRQPNLSPSTIFEKLMKYYEPLFEKLYHDDYPKRHKDLDQLKILIGEYGDLQSFVDDTALDPPESISADPFADPATQGKLILSTIHSSKGLEWDTVFVLSLADSRFPHPNVFPGDLQYEEERRLLYVAATRAENRLYLTYPMELMSPDRKFIRTTMSPFLRELSVERYTAVNGTRQRESLYTPSFLEESTTRHHQKKPKKQLSARKTYEKGMRVHHSFFGPGTIREIPGPRRVEVAFDRHGTKILHLDFAELEIVS
ncbi:MAG: ATP-dependent helicase [Desulfobulbaceae bacterium]|nr:ATP-dependent helicase [Desulfobulbaceae bacterium]